MWAELQEYDIVIHYAHPTSKDVVRVAVIQYLIDKLDRPKAGQWVAGLLDRAYGESQRNKRIKILINPFGGKGSAQKWYSRDIEPILAAARCSMDVERTQFKGHAVCIAEGIDIETYDVIATCSGDGLTHEVFNGLGKKVDARRALANVAVVQLPCGTGNALSWSLNGTDSTSLAALCTVKGIRTPLDLVSVTQGNTRTLSFLSQAVGMIAESDLGTEHLRWLGDARFTYGLLTRLLKKTIYPCDVAIKVAIDSKAGIKEHFRTTCAARASMEERRRQPEPLHSPRLGEGPGLPDLQYGTIADDLPPDWELVPYNNLGTFYCGNLVYVAAKSPFFAAALPHDGLMDLVTVDGDIGRMAAIKLLLAVEENKLFDMPLVNYQKLLGYRIIPKGGKDGYISIDGERVPFAPFQAEVHHGLGTVLSRNGHSFVAEGVAAKDLA